MEYSKQTLDEMYAKLMLDDEDEGGIIIKTEEAGKNADVFILVGRFLTEKHINFTTMQNVLASVWRPKEGVEIHDIRGLRYSFVFYHPMDLQKVLEGGPRSFEQSMLVYSKVQENEDPKTVQLNDSEIWVQVYDVPKGFISENILKSIGNYIGQYIKSDPTNFDGVWKACIRIRVKMNVLSPLKRRMKIKRAGGAWSWINFKYERLSTFCFVCGILGHSERDCNVVYANPGKEVERAYGTWLRAPGRNIKNATGARWLRNGGGGQQWTGGATKANFSGKNNDKEDLQARFQESEGIVSEYHGDQGEIRVIAKNQEFNNNSNLNMVGLENEKNQETNIVFDTKRRRVEINEILSENGPVNMHTDGPSYVEEQTQQHESSSSKNLQMVGTGYQARLEL